MAIGLVIFQFCYFSFNSLSKSFCLVGLNIPYLATIIATMFYPILQLLIFLSFVVVVVLDLDLDLDWHFALDKSLPHYPGHASLLCRARLSLLITLKHTGHGTRSAGCAASAVPPFISNHGAHVFLCFL